MKERKKEERRKKERRKEGRKEECKDKCSYLVLEVGDGEEEQLEQLVESGQRHLSPPLAQDPLVDVLQHPQAADQQVPRRVRAQHRLPLQKQVRFVSVKAKRVSKQVHVCVCVCFFKFVMFEMSPPPAGLQQ